MHNQGDKNHVQFLQDSRAFGKYACGMLKGKDEQTALAMIKKIEDQKEKKK